MTLRIKLKMYFSLLLTLLSYLYFCNGEKIYNKNCRQGDNITIICNHIPKEIPTGTLKFRLETPGTLVLNSSTFTTKNWSKLQYLEFTEVEKTHVVFKDNCLNRLHALEELHIHIWIPEVSKNSFSGLDYTTTLDLSGCGSLSIEQVKLALSGLNILPGLRKIVLSNWNLYEGQYAVDNNLIETILPRNITHIDISSSQISTINVTAVSKKLTALEVINASYTKIGDTYGKGMLQEDLKHIKVLDMSHAVLPMKAIPALPIEFHFYDKIGNSSNIKDNLYKNLFTPETVNYSGIIPHTTSLWIYNFTLIIDTDPLWYSKSIILQQNNFKRLDIQLICHIFYFSSVLTLDISNNGLEFLHPTLLSCLRNLVKVDLSKNQLFKMVEENSLLFQDLFSGSKYLKSIGMSANGLHKIPRNLFQNCRSVEKIDLSNNRLEQVYFTLSDLDNLKVLNLQGNNIHILDSLSINNLNSIPHKKVNTSTLILMLNPLLCSVCEAKSSLRWLISTNLFNTVFQKLKCLGENGKHYDINGKTLEMVKIICERKTVIISTIIAVAITFLICLICTLIIYKRIKKRQKNRKMENIIRGLLKGEGKYKFAVFLSFSNEDETFVNTYVLNQLNANLQEYTGIDRTLVCTGDQHFRLGQIIHEEIFRLLESASVLIVVVSYNFLNSGLCQSELEKAYGEGKPIILMFKERVDPDHMTRTMKSLYQKYTRILWTVDNGEYVLKTSWENICTSILDLI